MNMKKSTTNGFTIIETLVALAILMLAIAGPLYAANRALVTAQIARDQLTASHLAQEGIEYVRMMRDDEYLAAYQNDPSSASFDAWDKFIAVSNDSTNPASISNCRNSTNTCSLDPMLPMGLGSGSSLKQCSAAACKLLYRTTDGEYVTQDYITVNSIPDAVATPFSRTIQIVGITGAPQNENGVPFHDQRVISTVSWSSHGIPYTVKITDHITRWQ